MSVIASKYSRLSCALGHRRNVRSRMVLQQRQEACTAGRLLSAPAGLVEAEKRRHFSVNVGEDVGHDGRRAKAGNDGANDDDHDHADDEQVLEGVLAGLVTSEPSHGQLCKTNKFRHFYPTPLVCLVGDPSPASVPRLSGADRLHAAPARAWRKTRALPPTGGSLPLLLPSPPLPHHAGGPFALSSREASPAHACAVVQPSLASARPPAAAAPPPPSGRSLRVARLPRSDEHTSELQSPCNLVCR